MKILWADKDGGPDSHVWYYGIESKRFGSIVLMLFRKGSRDCYHSHAFNSIGWVLKGELDESFLDPPVGHPLRPSFRPVYTYRNTIHQVKGMVDKTWVFALRGPWVDYWQEFSPNGKVTLTHGRKVV